MLLLHWVVLIGVHLLDSKSELILVYDRLGPLDTSYLILLRCDNGVIVWQELVKSLVDVLDSEIVDVQHLCWDLLI